MPTGMAGARIYLNEAKTDLLKVMGQEKIWTHKFSLLKVQTKATIEVLNGWQTVLEQANAGFLDATELNKKKLDEFAQIVNEKSSAKPEDASSIELKATLDKDQLFKDDADQLARDVVMQDAAI